MPNSIATQSTPLLVAHRGDSFDFPENTKDAFDAAISSGIEAIELDLRMSADGHVIVCHDASLKKFGGNRTPLRKINLKTIQDQDVGSWFNSRFSGSRIMSLDDLLSRYSSKVQLLLEIKPTRGLHLKTYNQSLCKEIVKIVRRHKAELRVFILCFNVKYLEFIFEIAPNIRLIRNYFYPPRNIQRLENIQIPLHALDFDHRHIDRKLVESVHRLGIRVFTWSCNTDKELRKVMSLGVDGVLSDRPNWLVKKIRKLCK